VVVEGGGDVIQRFAGAVVDLPAQIEQRVTALVFQDPPPLQRVEGEGGVASVAIGHPEDAGVAVTGAVGVARFELLHQQHVAAVASQLPGGGRPHGAATDDDHLMVGHGGSV